MYQTDRRHGSTIATILISSLITTFIGISGALASDLAHYYSGIQSSLVAKGYLRQDRDADAASMDADTLSRNFVEIALKTEYAPGSGLTRSQRSKPLLRWEKPVRVGVVFGSSVSVEQRVADKALIRDYARRLGKIMDHPVSVTNEEANFHVLVINDSERKRISKYLKKLVPDIDAGAINAVKRMRPNDLCMVVAFPNADRTLGYDHAIAIVRAEHPDKMRVSCIQEELAQGMGLPNDCDIARPSIFNDDEEFGVLTKADERLLKMLYSPRLKSGMTLDAISALLPDLAQSALSWRG